MIGTIYAVIIDCPDPERLARFYADVVGGIPERDSEGWWILHAGAYHLAFQLAPDLREPQWPDPERPQQFHLDVQVPDLDEGERAVLELGATRLPGESEGFRVFADPAGHPFCLVL